jgi:hypothetical protein
VLIAGLQSAHDAEVDCRITRILRIVELYEYISRVHVGVEKIVPEHLGEKNLDAVLGQLGDIRAARPQLIHPADDDAVYAFHHHDIDAAIVPIDVGHVEQRGARKIPLKLRGVGGLAHEVQFVQDGLAILVHDLDRAQAPGILPILVRQRGKGVQDFQVQIDDCVHAWPQDLDDHILSGFQRCRMHLRDRGGGEWFGVEAGEYISEPGGQRVFDGCDGDIAAERRHPILEFGQFVGDVERYQVAACREGLAEFDEYRPEFLQREPEPLAAGVAGAALEPGPRRKVEQEPERRIQMSGAYEFVQPVPDQRALYRQQPDHDAKSHQAEPFNRCSRRAMRASTRSAVSRSVSTP